MSRIEDRLRNEDCPTRFSDTITECQVERREAADEIARLRGEVEREGARADANSELLGKVEREWTGRLARGEAERDALREALIALLDHTECPCESLGKCPMAKARALLSSSPASEPDRIEGDPNSRSSASPTTEPTE